MIIRSVLIDPTACDRIDFFNDFRDTFNWVWNLERGPTRDEAIYRLAIAAGQKAAGVDLTAEADAVRRQWQSQREELEHRIMCLELEIENETNRRQEMETALDHISEAKGCLCGGSRTCALCKIRQLARNAVAPF